MPELTLLDPGTEPRSPLRINYTPGDTVTIDFTIDQSIDQAVQQGDQRRPQRFDSPPITQRLTYTVTAVDDEGRATFTVAVLSAEAQTKGTELDAEAALLLQAQLQPLRGLAGEGRVDDHGIVDRFSMDLPDSLEPSLATQIETLNQQVSRLAKVNERMQMLRKNGEVYENQSSLLKSAGGRKVKKEVQFALPQI